MLPMIYRMTTLDTWNRSKIPLEAFISYPIRKQKNVFLLSIVQLKTGKILYGRIAHTHFTI